MEYKGYLKRFPQEVVEWMCDQQEAQGNKRDVSVFEKSKFDGFNWFKTKEGYDFCKRVIVESDFDLFFEHFPKKENKMFNEKSLQEDIIKTWGEFGAHNEVFNDMVKKIKNLDTKEENINDILEECKRRFKEGDKLISAKGTMFIFGGDMEISKNEKICGNEIGSIGYYYLYSKGKYATLVEEEKEILPFKEEIDMDSNIGIKGSDTEQYPEVMWCWDDDISDFDSFVVIGKFKDRFMCIENCHIKEFESRMLDLEIFTRDILFYKNASLTKPVKDYTREQVLKEFNINIID